MTTDDEQLLREMWCAYTLHATPMPFSVREAMAAVLAVVRENDPMIHELRRVIATLEYKLNLEIKRINHVHTPDCHAHGCNIPTV